MSDWGDLFERFKRDFDSGAAASALPYLDEAAAEDRQVLFEAIDRYLEMETTRRRWDEEAFMQSPARKVVERVERAMVGSSGEWPILLPELRLQAKVKRSEVVDRLADSLQVEAEGDREKVADYYHQMESGLLPWQGVSASVIDSLASIFGVTADLLRRSATRGGGMASPGTEVAMARVGAPDPDYAGGRRVGAAGAEASIPESEWDEVDRLFRSGGAR